MTSPAYLPAVDVSGIAAPAVARTSASLIVGSWLFAAKNVFTTVSGAWKIARS